MNFNFSYEISFLIYINEILSDSNHQNKTFSREVKFARHHPYRKMIVFKTKTKTKKKEKIDENKFFEKETIGQKKNRRVTFFL